MWNTRMVAREYLVLHFQGEAKRKNPPRRRILLRSSAEDSMDAAACSVALFADRAGRRRTRSSGAIKSTAAEDFASVQQQFCKWARPYWTSESRITTATVIDCCILPGDVNLVASAYGIYEMYSYIAPLSSRKWIAHKAASFTGCTALLPHQIFQIMGTRLHPLLNWALVRPCLSLLSLSCPESPTTLPSATELTFSYLSAECVDAGDGSCPNLWDWDGFVTCLCWGVNLYLKNQMMEDGVNGVTTDSYAALSQLSGLAEMMKTLGIHQATIGDN